MGVGLDPGSPDRTNIICCKEFRGMNPNKERTFLGHPVGLYVLFFTEMWERFSYYGMRGLLILYMVNYFRWSQAEASNIYKIYTSLVYVTPIIGGYLADRYLGNRVAVIIGALLMAVGHFLMAFEEFPIFIAALVFLIFGNGFFKPNMSAQVGRLYPANDGRRDGAYTIFYMGINLGAFIAPLACGYLQENTLGGYHAGFALAGIGMVIGLITYLAGQPFIKEVHPDTVVHAETKAELKELEHKRPLTEAEAAEAPSAIPTLSAAAPTALTVLGGALIAFAVGAAITPRFELPGMNFWDAVMVAMGGVCLMLVGRVCKEVTGGLRDRVLAILAMGIFVIFFWGAFEQAGNALNLWADKTTNRYLTEPMPVPDAVLERPVAEAAVDEDTERGVSFATRMTNLFRFKPTKEGDPQSSTSSINPVPTASFQSINALAIFLIAPIFSWLWIWLDRRGKQPSIPVKMAIGLVFMSLSMAVMALSGKVENQPTTGQLKVAALPGSVARDDEGRLGTNEIVHEADKSGPEKAIFHPFDAGRLKYDQPSGELRLMGVLPDTERDRIIAHAAPKEFKDGPLAQLLKESQTISDEKKEVRVPVNPVPEGFDLKFSGIPVSAVDFQNGELIATEPLEEKEEQGLLVAAADPQFRDSIQKLFQDSAIHRVSPMWLVWSFILATLGELCLSPVGLSMVSKLAPARYVTMLMGVLLLVTAFGNFAAGQMGEIWGTIPPIPFFLLLTGVVAGAALVLYVVAKKIEAAMHGVK
jgi:POT family proton-dependent oligopeptide transporter